MKNCVYEEACRRFNGRLRKEENSEEKDEI